MDQIIKLSLTSFSLERGGSCGGGKSRLECILGVLIGCTLCTTSLLFACHASISNFFKSFIKIFVHIVCIVLSGRFRDVTDLRSRLWDSEFDPFRLFDDSFGTFNDFFDFFLDFVAASTSSKS